MNAATKILNAAVGLGPRGGNLDDPRLTPDSRRAPLNATVDPATGLPGLHNKNGWHDSTVQGWDKEPAWARMAAFMLLQGRTNSEIGMAANVHPNTVAQIRGQRWFQELLATLANESGEAALGLLQAEAIASVQAIVDIRDTAECERARLAAAVFIVEQVNGKAIQKTINLNASTTFASPDAEMAAIEEQLVHLRAARQQHATPLPAEPTAQSQPS